MEHWVAEVAGRPVIVFFAEDRELAEEVIGDIDTRGALMVTFDAAGKELWDGDTPITLRLASAEEMKLWEEKVREAVMNEYFADREEAIGDGFFSFLFTTYDRPDPDR